VECVSYCEGVSVFGCVCMSVFVHGLEGVSVIVVF